jgi:hypothetical protein
MAFELPEDSTLVSELSSTPIESPAPLGEVEIPIAADKDFGEAGVDGAIAVEEFERSVELNGELTEPELEPTPLLKEEALDWEDIASEIDLQLAEGELAEESDETLQGGPVESSPLEDEFATPADDLGLTVEEESAIGDATGEDIWDEVEENPAETEVTELMEESPLFDPVDSPSLEKEIENDLKETAPIGEPEEVVGTSQNQDEGETLDAQGLSAGGSGLTDDATNESDNKFYIGDVIREAWAKIKGAKGAIWAGSAIMYLVILIIVAGGAFLLPSLDSDLTNVTGLVSNILLQAVTNIFSALFTAGLLLMGVKKVAGDQISWKMIFKGFSCAGKIIVATILQFILVSIGFLLLVLPGIYLTVGYAMTLPLIVDKNLSPWQAMEMSRKAVHKIWWKVAGLAIVMILIFVVSLIPLGIGLIWTWPMFIILAGVVYQYLFAGEGKIS